jgi:hypothetical protein
MFSWRRESALDLYKFGLGAFVFLSPWLFAFVYQPARVDAWASGLAVMVASIAALIVFVDWEEWLALALGLWMMASPWILALPHVATKILFAAGLICVYLAGLELWLLHDDAPGNAKPR